MFDHVTDAYSNRGINVKKSRSSVMGNSPKNDYEAGHNHELDAFLSNNVLFENIIDYDNIKKIFLFAITSNLPVHILLVGPPGSAKTLFCFKAFTIKFTSSMLFESLPIFMQSLISLDLSLFHTK